LSILRSGREFVNAVIDPGVEKGFNFGEVAGDEKKLVVKADGHLYYDDELVGVGDPVKANGSTFGVVNQGARMTIADGVASANQQTWTDILAGSSAGSVAAPNVSIFNNDATYQTATQITNAITQAIEELGDYVRTGFVVDSAWLTENPTSGYALGDFVLIGHDDSVLARFNTIAEVDLSIRTGAELDPLEADPSIDQEAIYLVVNFGTPYQTFTNLTSILPTFVGHNGEHIQTEVASGIISATLKAGTIQKDRLTAGFQAEIDAKMAKVTTATLNNVAIFAADGSVKDSEENLNDYVKKADLETELDGYVTLDTAQTITGAKTFDEPVMIGGTEFSEDGIDTDGAAFKIAADGVFGSGTTAASSSAANKIVVLGSNDMIETQYYDATPSTVSLTDAAASNTLPATGSATVVSLLQTTRNALKWLMGRFDAVTGHKHDGSDSPKISYNDLLDKPGAVVTANIGEETEDVTLFNASVYKAVNVEYIITKSGMFQRGTLKFIVNGSTQYMLNTMVFGDETGVLFESGVGTAAGDVTITNADSNADIKFVVTYL